jgi:hypothetical protein
MSVPFTKLYRHRDHKIEVELQNLYNVIQLLRTDPRYINARAYAERIGSEFRRGEISLLSEILHGSYTPARMRLTEVARGARSDPLLELKGGNAGATYVLKVTGGCAIGTTQSIVQIEVDTSTNSESYGLNIKGGGTDNGQYLLAIEPDAGFTGRLISGAGGFLNTSGNWIDASDENLKDMEEDEDIDDVLQKVLTIPMKRFKYKRDKTRAVHSGATAQDWNRIFGNRSPDGIGGRDAAMVAIAGVQSLASKVEALEARIAKLEDFHA